MNTNPSAPLGARVTAVIVTFNKLSWLQRNIQAMKSQSYPLHSIIVIDNCSTDGTAEWLSQQSGLSVHRLSHNSGGSGGFHAGMVQAMQTNPDWLWLMDDDTEPTANALEQLMLRAAEKPLAGFFNSLVLWSDGRPCRMNIPPAAWEFTDELMDSGGKVVQISACSFVSCLVNAQYVPKIGLPVKEFFIWYDDFEYTQRLAARAPGYLVMDSLVHHFTGENRGVDWSQVNDKNYWKYSFGMRNEAAVTLWSNSAPFIARLFKLFARWIEVGQQLAAGNVSWKLRLKLYRKALLGACWNFKRNIEYPAADPSVTPVRFDSAQLSHRRYSGMTWDAAYGNDLFWQIHPPQPGTDAPVTLGFDGIPATAKAFSCKVFVADKRAAAPVKFCASVVEGGAVIASKSVTVERATAPVEFQLEFPDGSTAKRQLRVFTEMAPDAPNNFFCSSFWIDPKFISHGARLS